MIEPSEGDGLSKWSTRNERPHPLASLTSGLRPRPTLSKPLTPGRLLGRGLIWGGELVEELINVGIRVPQCHRSCRRASIGSASEVMRSEREIVNELIWEERVREFFSICLERASDDLEGLIACYLTRAPSFVSNSTVGSLPYAAVEHLL